VLATGGKKYDTKEDLLKDLGVEELVIDLENVEEITISGNSYGQGACDYIASVISQETPKLTVVNFSDMFVGRKREELPGSLEVLVRSLMKKQIVELDLSHNAFGPDGIKSFDFIFKQMSGLKVFKASNCGLGPVSFKKLLMIKIIGRWRNDCCSFDLKQRSEACLIFGWQRST
jgi:Ran GTPase-activating protein 1